ncbi:MAG: hypothetical protein M1608_10725 [Candidatus Omnitrophica bacterium]|nr:hypothetical protein [Candidatus Omnitrophota bacterium]
MPRKNVRKAPKYPAMQITTQQTASSKPVERSTPAAQERPKTPAATGTEAPKSRESSGLAHPAPVPKAAPAGPSAPLKQSEPEKNAASAEPSPVPSVPSTVDVVFALQAPHARKVQLCGEFNNWIPEATPMKQVSGGRWEATVPLPQGSYQYKFVVDGQWMHDPEAPRNVPNLHGSLNSVIEVCL